MAFFDIDENGNKLYVKKYEDREYLTNEFVVLGRTPKQIANDNNVSYKLINTWLKTFGLVSGDVRTV